MKVLAFDSGIRNLAWCLMESATAPAKPAILGWQNYDLLAGSGTQEAKDAAKVKCSVCAKALATFQAPGAEPTCQRPCAPAHPPFTALSGVVLKPIPALATLRDLVAGKGLTVPKRAIKAQLVAALATVNALPLEKLKVKKAVETDMMRMHDAIRAFVLEKESLFKQATHVLLENQPVLKNPTMKTVQLLLFATLRDVLQVPGQVYRLVHAGKKVKGAATGDAGYKERKSGSETKVEEALKGGKVVTAGHLEKFMAESKRSDLADAFCMCLDALSSATTS